MSANQTALSILESPLSGQDKSRRDDLLRTWLVKFSANHQAQGKESPVTEKTLPVFLSLWEEGFSDIPDDLLEGAFILTLRACKFFPTVSDVRSQIETRKKVLSEQSAEDAWQKILAYVNEWCHPDGLVTFGAVRPQLSPQADHALRAAGGGRYLWGCPTDQLVWAKKAFIEDYTRQSEMPEAERMLGAGEASSVLRKLAAGHAALPPANPDWEKKYPPPKIPADLPRLHIVPRHEMTQAEWDERRAFLRAQADEIMSRQGAAQ